MINRYSIGALVIVLLVVGGYAFNFHYLHGQVFSKSSADWGAFGDYFGGVIGPVLSFLALVLLIKSLSLQNEANLGLKKQLDNSERTEAIKSFESLFFNLINSQIQLIEKFEIHHIVNGNVVKSIGVDAVVRLEDEIDAMRDAGASKDQVSELIEILDEEDKIYDLLRPFSVSVNVVSENLSDDRGFDSSARKFYFGTLINFLTFAHLRLILISVQFLDVHHASNLRGHNEFNEVLVDLGLELDKY